MKLLRPILTGLIVAILLLSVYPPLRNNNILPAIGSWLPINNSPVSYKKAVQRAAPAVVYVYNRSLSASTNSELNIISLGSGVIMSKRGYILTNQHVIANAEQIIVTLQTGQIYEAQLVGYDMLTDLAVIKINARNLPVIPINPNRKPQIGDVVLAIGNPFGLTQSVTQGIISSVNRFPDIRQRFLQTDASINKGNSGGALVNSLGELVGINTLSLDKSTNGETPEGIGFAIPTDMATKIMEKLIRDGRVIRGYLGIQPALYNSQGITVVNVHAGSPAQNAGIKQGDILLKIAGIPVTSVFDVTEQVAELTPGSEIPIEIQRHNQKMTFNVLVTEMPTVY